MITPGIYRHFKGNYYRVLGVATHSETLVPMVVYEALYHPFSRWVRPLSNFEEYVHRPGDPSYNGPRFSLVQAEGEPVNVEKTEGELVEAIKDEPTN